MGIPLRLWLVAQMKQGCNKFLLFVWFFLCLMLGYFLGFVLFAIEQNFL